MSVGDQRRMYEQQQSYLRRPWLYRVVGSVAYTLVCPGHADVPVARPRTATSARSRFLRDKTASLPFHSVLPDRSQVSLTSALGLQGFLS